MIALLAFAFLIGSIPFGVLIAKAFHVPDPRTLGSGNVGATNLTRAGGLWPAGILTFLMDLLKGAGPALAVATGAIDQLGVEWLPSSSLGLVGGLGGLAWAVGLCAVLGHCFSPWLGFNGGKGVATAAGVVAVLSPFAALAGFLVFALVFSSRKIVSLASLSASVAAVATQVALFPVHSYLWAGAVMIFVVILRHESNIDALLEDRESRFR
jgi:acyl phosphate:glycerol-3-phosphate acyltransferase